MTPQASEFLSRDTYDALVQQNAERKNRRGENVHLTAEKKEQGETNKAELDKQLFGFLSALRDAGRLGAYPDADHLSLNNAGAWNSFVRADYTDVADHEGRLFRKVDVGTFHRNDITTPAYRMLFQDAYRGVSYEDACQTLEKGDLPWWNWGSGEECRETGVNVQPSFEGWQLSLTTMVNGKEVPVNDETVPSLSKLFHNKVDFPTGEIIVADWIHIEGFTEHCDALEGGENINTVAGCVERTRRYLEDGMIHVFVGGTSPSISTGSDGLAAVTYPHRTGVSEKADDSAFERAECLMYDLPKVSTRLWWVTVIDKARLVDILTPMHGEEKARNLIDDYVTKDGVHGLTIEPGTHHLYHAGKAHHFAECFPEKAMEYGLSANVVTPLFVLANRSLDLGCEAEPVTPTPTI